MPDDTHPEHDNIHERLDDVEKTVLGKTDVPVTRGQLATILHRQGGGPDG